MVTTRRFSRAGVSLPLRPTSSVTLRHFFEVNGHVGSGRVAVTIIASKPCSHRIEAFTFITHHNSDYTGQKQSWGVVSFVSPAKGTFVAFRFSVISALFFSTFSALMLLGLRSDSLYACAFASHPPHCCFGCAK